MPQPLRNFSHQAKPKKAASGAHPKKHSASRFCVQAIAELQPQKSRNVAFGTPKNNEFVPQPLRNCSHLAKPKKAASGAHPKNVAFGTPKNNEIVPQPLRNCSHQAKPKKAASGAHPKKQSPSRFCVQAIAELQPQKSRNVAFGTPKNNEIVPQPLRNFSHQAKPKKAASGAHPKKQSPSRFCVQAIAELQPQKSRNVAFGTPKNNESCPSHCDTAATWQSPRKLRRERIRKTLRLEPLKTMKSCPSHCETSATRQSLRKLRRRNTLLGALPLSEGSADFGIVYYIYNIHIYACFLSFSVFFGCFPTKSCFPWLQTCLFRGCSMCLGANGAAGLRVHQPSLYRTLEGVK